MTRKKSFLKKYKFGMFGDQRNRLVRTYEKSVKKVLSLEQKIESQEN